MAYIDYDAYVRLTGDTQTEREEAEALLGPASDLVDGMCGGRLGESLTVLGERVRSAVEKAAAIQARYLADNGGMAAALGGIVKYTGSVSIGSFRYGDGRLTDVRENGISDSRVCSAALDALMPTGLLFPGVGR